MDEQGWTAVVEAAIRAPSIHNTQPWRFTARGDRLEVRLDPDRALPVLDPGGRQQVISCGVAVEFAAVALRAAGHAGEVELLPGADRDHLATVRLGSPHEATAEDRALRGDRPAAHRARPVPAAGAPRRAGRPAAGRRRPAGRPGQADHRVGGGGRHRLPHLPRRGEGAERPRVRGRVAALAAHRPRRGGRRPLRRRPERGTATRPSNWLIRDFVVGTSEPHGRFLPEAAAGAPPPAVERPTVVLLGTANDDRAAWLLAGQALGRLLLQATAEGVASSPLTQALD